MEEEQVPIQIFIFFVCERECLAVALYEVTGSPVWFRSHSTGLPDSLSKFGSES